MGLFNTLMHALKGEETQEKEAHDPARQEENDRRTVALLSKELEDSRRHLQSAKNDLMDLVAVRMQVEQQKIKPLRAQLEKLVVQAEYALKR